MDRLRILIIGGYGTFGGRLAKLLADESRLTLLVAGRSRDKAAAFCASVPFKAEAIPLTFDRDGDVEAQIRTTTADIVVDATGPFQTYGDDPYRVVRACLSLGIDYLDLADGSAFVDGITRFDEEARDRNICILTGVSSVPVLTAAVVKHLSENLSTIETITGGIAPSPYAGVGLNVIRAIAGYAGKPVRLVRDGGSAIGYAWTETMRYTIAPPGRLPLKTTRFSLVDVPDLREMQKIWPDVRAVWMGAGPVPEILHRGLNALAWLVRLKVLLSLAPLSPIFHHVINVLRWGEHRGGMFVQVSGRSNAGTPVKRSWHLLAEGDDGPFIPSMAIAAIVRHRLRGKRPAYGARPATQDLSIGDYEELFETRAICTGIRDTGLYGADNPLYQRVLSDAWSRLPTQIQTMHTVTGAMTADGMAVVERGRNPVARLAAAIFRFPTEGRNIPVQVTFELRDGAEIWHRTFAGQSFKSVQSLGSGHSEWLIDEKLGPFTFSLALVLDGDRLRLVLRRWRFLALPLPAWLAPSSESFEAVENGRFRFYVEISHPFTGLIVRYQGWLRQPTSDSPQPAPALESALPS